MNSYQFRGTPLPITPLQPKATCPTQANPDTPTTPTPANLIHNIHSFVLSGKSLFYRPQVTQNYVIKYGIPYVEKAVYLEHNFEPYLTRFFFYPSVHILYLQTSSRFKMVKKCFRRVVPRLKLYHNNKHKDEIIWRRGYKYSIIYIKLGPTQINT